MFKKKPPGQIFPEEFYDMFTIKFWLKQGESKMSYTAKILASISIFLILLFLGVISIVLGFMVIEMANTTIIENMETSDWVLVTIGTVLVFGCFVFIQLMDLIKRIL